MHYFVHLGLFGRELENALLSFGIEDKEINYCKMSRVIVGTYYS